MMNYFLLVQIMASWPASPTQVQIMGPMNDRTICLDSQQQIEKTFQNVRALCIGLPQGQQPASTPPAAAK